MKALLWVLFAGLISPSVSSQNAFDTLKAVRQMEEKFNIELITDSFSGGDYARRWASWTTPVEADSAVFAEFISVFADEWMKYPAAWLKVNGLKKIVFCKNLKVTHQMRFAMPDPYDETLYYDIEYLLYGEKYVREMSHHEFWHMIDEEQFGDMFYHNVTWCSFNSSSFRYGDGGSAAYDDGVYEYGEHTTKGFVTTYSMYGEEEDRAELYCWLFTPRTWELLTFWVTEDRILKKKFDWMIDFIESKVPEMDMEYYEKINNIED